MNKKNVYSGFPQDEDRAVEATLRPASFDKFIGCKATVENLKTWIQGARKRDECLDHILFSGPPGLGKTTLAYIIAAETGANIIPTSGPALSKPRDLVGILTSLTRGDVLFIDETHRIDVRIEEYLYTAMEDFRISIVIDPGPHSRSVSMSLNPFTLVGATTREGLLTAPLRSRFQILERLDFYGPDELERIVINSAGILRIKVRRSAAHLIASRSRGTPRVVNRFLRRIRDVADARGSDVITDSIAAEGLTRLGVDEQGLCEMDRRILKAIARNGGGPMGLKTVSVIVGEQDDTVEDVYEPFLIRQGLLERTARGRVLTPRGLAMAQGQPGEDGSSEGQRSLF